MVIVIEPDRKNGMIIAERSNGELFVKILSLLLMVVLTIYYYWIYPEEFTWWSWIIALIIFYFIVEYILQRTLEPIMERYHKNPERKKYYFRSGIATCKERYNQSEKDELTEKQKEEPVLFIAKEKGKTEKYYYRFEDRTWVSTEKLDLETVKTEIEAYLKMKNI